jgi:hypothetical protein
VDASILGVPTASVFREEDYPGSHAEGSSMVLMLVRPCG